MNRDFYIKRKKILSLGLVRWCTRIRSISNSPYHEGMGVKELGLAATRMGADCMLIMIN